MTIQRVVGLRTLRIRAQVSLVLRQWEVAEENWIKTHELAELQATTKPPARARSRASARPSGAVGTPDGSRSASSSDPDNRRRTNTGERAERVRASAEKPESDAKRRSGTGTDGRRSTSTAVAAPSADVRRSSAVPGSKLPSSRSSVADK